MKRFKIYHAFIMSLLIMMSSCISDFEEVNKNKLYPDEEQKTLDGLAAGGLFPPFIENVIPTGSSGTGQANNYQVTINMTGDNWMGYFSPGDYPWDGGVSLPNYYAGRGRLDGIHSVMISRIVNPFMEIKAAMHDVENDGNGNLIYKKKDLASQSVFSVAQIVKIMGYHKTTDMFGPVPYSKIGAGKLTVPYDSQQEVYSSFLAELQEAVETLNKYLAGGGSKIIEEYDAVYQGNTLNWIKLGNSLMLRLAMRVYYADRALCEEYVRKATTNPGGLLESKDDIAKLETNGRFIFKNSLFVLWSTYGEVKMGATLYSYLKGYSDARIGKYFSKGNVDDTEDYFAVRSGINKITDRSLYDNFSKPDIPDSAPTYWMKASEVQFLLAEAALYGIIGGDAKDYYEKGIALSFDENGLNVGDYATTSGTPSDYTDPKNAENNSAALSTLDKKWDNVTSEEEHLEQIITQKYIAIFPDGLEAWSEWRRTGYPRVFPIIANKTNIGTQDISPSGTEGGMRRLPFSDKEYRLNTENVNNAKGLLQGPDNAATNVWWDKKNKN